MRKHFLQLFLILSASFAASATQGQTTLLTMTNTLWRYYQEGNQPPDQGALTWHEPDYDDSSWADGPGAFGVESDAPFAPGVVIRTPLALSNGNAPQTITYYFRTSFEYSQDPVGSELVFSNVIDEGAVVYLNGTQLYRYRMAGTATPTYSTLAQGGNPEGQIEVTNIISSPALRHGVNTIAVEVHQSSATSSDIVFGMALLARRAQPVTITKQPENQTVVIGEELRLSVEVTGDYPRFQWYRNDIAMAGATGPEIRYASATANLAGPYHVVVSSPFNTVTSATAVVQVIPDTFSPVPLTAIVEESSRDRVVVTFDDTLISVFQGSSPHGFRSATNVLNYQIHAVGDTTPMSVNTASASGRALRLIVSPNFDPTQEYYISFYNITDDRTNVVRRNEQIGIQFRRTANLVHPNQVWKWTAMWNSNLPPAWTTNDYVPSPALWAEDPGPFLYDVAQPSTCMLPLTQVPIGYDTYYFRTKFVLPANINPAESALRFTHLLDDGAIFYLNGVEAFRTNMPPGAAQYNTRALASWEANTCRSNIIPATLLRPGTNVVAVEVHQFEPLGDDIAFGLNLDALYTEGLRIPEITFQRLPTDPSALVLTWPGEGWTLEQNSTPATNGWSAISTTVNAYTNTTPNLFFRLRRLQVLSVPEFP